MSTTDMQRLVDWQSAELSRCKDVIEDQAEELERHRALVAEMRVVAAPGDDCSLEWLAVRDSLELLLTKHGFGSV